METEELFFKMANGFTVKDPRLGRLIQFDERSRAFPVREILKGKEPRSYTWKIETCLDQGQEGACVGFGVTHELLCNPAPVKTLNAKHARMIYQEAKKVDEWPGEDYEGTSVLAGCKVVRKLGWIDSYRWAFGFEDLLLGVGYNGPAVLGLIWHSDMMDTDASGFIHYEGYKMGGHAILCSAVNVKDKYFTLHNSWGSSWGEKGKCKISFGDMEALLKRSGEAVFFVGRHNVAKPKGAKK